MGIGYWVKNRSYFGGSATFGSDVDIKGALEVEGNVNIVGLLTGGTVAGDIAGTTLHLTGAGSIGGALAVVGAGSVGGAFQVAGSSHIATLQATGAAQFDAAVAVTGTSALAVVAIGGGTGVKGLVIGSAACVPGTIGNAATKDIAVADAAAKADSVILINQPATLAGSVAITGAFPTVGSVNVRFFNPGAGAAVIAGTVAVSYIIINKS